MARSRRPARAGTAEAKAVGLSFGRRAIIDRGYELTRPKVVEHFAATRDS
jgi:hypothetical protein